jgi:4-methyl-5(b-hydroxyethyl)-thiazole monophosphate biosynthesis
MSNTSTEHKVALFLADGCETIEALTVADILFRAGIPCTKVSVTDTPVVVSSHKVTMVADTTIGHLDFDSFDMLVLPGGMPGTLNLKACKALTDQVVRFHKEGRMIAAICAAPSVFAELGILKGVRAACNPTVEDSLNANGAVLVRENAVKDGNIITSRGAGTAEEFALATLASMTDTETADRIRKQVVAR